MKLEILALAVLVAILSILPAQIATAQMPITLQQIISGSVAPTIDPITDNFGRPIITGTYDSSDNQQLRVFVAGVWYVFGVDSELSTDGDTWELDLTSLPEPLSPGQYTAVVEIINAIGETLMSTAEFTVLERPVHIPGPVEEELSSTGQSMTTIVILALFLVLAGSILLNIQRITKVFATSNYR